jgi:predicted alpha/beta-fold hydrolase
MAAVNARGWHGAIPHFRGCSGEPNRAPRFYHSGDAEELDWIIRRLRPRFSGPFHVAGVSLGGNALLRWLGEQGRHAGIVDAAVAVSAPLDLAAGGAALSSGFNRLYTRMFLQTLKPKALAKLERFPGLFDRDRLLAANDLYSFDNVVTAPLHGYRDTDDYWHRASARHVLHDIVVPTLVLNAKNDPFLPGRHLPQTAAPAVTLEYPDTGGHVGFSTGPFPGRLDWLPQRILTFFDDTAMRAPAPAWLCEA